MQIGAGTNARADSQGRLSMIPPFNVLKPRTTTRDMKSNKEEDEERCVAKIPLADEKITL
jgi:hypothetical protein